MSSTPSTAGPSTEGLQFEHKANAVMRALSLFGLMPGMVVAVVVAIVAGPLLGLLALVVVAVAWAVYVQLRARSSLDRLLTAIDARPLGADASPRWANVVDGLGATSGVSDVELWRRDAPEANALAAASADRCVIVVTDGLVEQLSVVELEGIAANLLGRVRDGSARYGTVTFGLLGGFLGSVEAAGKLVADGLGEQRDVQSDLAAVGATRYPPGLAAALEHLERIGTELPGVAPATAHLWLAPAVVDEVGVDPAISATVAQSLDYRAAVLHEL